MKISSLTIFILSTALIVTAGIRFSNAQQLQNETPGMNDASTTGNRGDAIQPGIDEPAAETNLQSFSYGERQEFKETVNQRLDELEQQSSDSDAAAGEDTFFTNTKMRVESSLDGVSNVMPEDWPQFRDNIAENLEQLEKIREYDTNSNMQDSMPQIP